MDLPAIPAAMRSKESSIVTELCEMAEVETPTEGKVAVDRLGGRVAARWRTLGGRVEVVANDRGGDHILGRFFEGVPGMPALVLGHIDTVWPLGTLRTMPLRREGGRLHGPGVYDMKAGLALFHAALEWFRESGTQPARPILALFTSDEETGSPTSRALIEECAGGVAHALVLEPPLADGGLKTGRKGVGRFAIEVRGKAAHAGVAPEQGASAILELAHQVIRAHGLNDPEAGTTVTVGLASGGTAVNVVPASATARVDVRATTLAAAATLERTILAFGPITPGTEVRVTGGFNRPPMERSPAIAALFGRARDIAGEIGLSLGEGSTGGGSDGNFTAAMGVPTLDGLGARGGGAHADHEHVEISSLSERAALLTALLLKL
ncbi:Carboxypeptidase G2 precursor [Aquisphaera giovannonii]|uniref:Carboxypeptidase G2 n=1 Tax=Aquisphaera giovannonii TaxID=406548 RepID=A0A5B9W0L0_9BACT|nr:M20 family metallopeptidase [Aquisphaera giovannonii]QEH33799.1 Carboxypeptidase G2 precursor [Aquisphaera giovannonii]